MKKWWDKLRPKDRAALEKVRGKKVEQFTKADLVLAEVVKVRKSISAIEDYTIAEQERLRLRGQH